MNGETAMNKHLNRALAMIAFAMHMNSAGAEPNEDTCLNRNGMLIRTAECDEWRKKQPSDIDCYNDEVCRSKAAAANQRRRDKAEQEAAASIAEARKQDEAYARKAKARAATMKAACGNDYKKPRIGMTLGRIRQCISEVVLTAELNRADGVMSTYETSDARFYVTGGKLVAWGFK